MLLMLLCVLCGLQDVAMLRASQFSEDSGPMAHPIRPDSYIKMDNFYTVTVYEKVRPSGRLCSRRSK
jgi:hypothetical protein